MTVNKLYMYLVGYVEPEVVADKRLRSIFPARLSGHLFYNELMNSSVNKGLSMGFIVHISHFMFNVLGFFNKFIGLCLE